ncbi:helix-loop-helix DNA-binding domain-containing protein [Apiospora saccharicola]|uniref:Helix-loop-helix DNA-binding domain-containing protein n=1 Tax=Apiospora saccharicola TaxID=335842 RepID=A0ABR1TL74_9PEZI
MSLPSHSFNAVAEPGGTAPSRQEQLEASLEALIGLDFGLFQGGSPEKRHLAPQIRHHDGHHHNHTTPSSQRWADPSTQHDCTAPASHYGHACGSGQQARYMQALKNAVLLLSAQSMHAGGGGACHDSPQFPAPQLDFEAGSNASNTPPTPADSYRSNSLDDYEFSNSFQFLDFEPNFEDTTVDCYTASTPRRQSSPSALLSDAITVAHPIETSTGDSARKKRRISTDRDTASPRRTSASESPSPQDTQKPHRPHAAVEKRYRVSLNDKIEALRVCLESRKRPKRRQCQATGGGDNGSSTTDSGATSTAGDGRGGPTPASSSTTTATPSTRMSKAEVLTEAVEYVRQLEEENGIMLEQIEALVERMQATQRALQLPSFMAGRS